MFPHLLILVAVLAASAVDSVAPPPRGGSDSTRAASDSLGVATGMRSASDSTRAATGRWAALDSTRTATGARPASDSSGVAAAPDTLSLPFTLVPAGEIPAGSGGPGPLTQPSGIGCDAFGNIYASDAALHRLQRYDADGVWLGEAGALGSGDGQLRRPGAIAPLGTLRMAVLDRENRRVQAYDLFGRLQGTLIDLESAEMADALGRVEPVDLAADRGGSLYLADADRDRVLVFDFEGRFSHTLGGFGARAGSFRGLSGLAVGRKGELFATERVNHRLQRLDPGGRVLATWPLAVRPARAALAVAADDSGRVAVADETSGVLWVFTVTGEPLARLAGLAAPRSLAFHRDGTLLVAESQAGRLRRFRLERRASPPDPAPPREE